VVTGGGTSEGWLYNVPLELIDPRDPARPHKKEKSDNLHTLMPLAENQVPKGQNKFLIGRQVNTTQSSEDQAQNYELISCQKQMQLKYFILSLQLPYKYKLLNRKLKMRKCENMTEKTTIHPVFNKQHYP